MHTLAVLASSRCRRVSSESTLPAFRLVDPKATSVLVSSLSSVCTRRKNSSSLGLAPGQPPSMYLTPSQSSCSAMRNLSSTVSEMPSSWLPSRSVVSKTSTDSGNRTSTSLSDMLHPVLVPVDLASNGGEVRLLDGLGHRAGLADHAVVDLADGHDLSRCPGQER